MKTPLAEVFSCEFCEISKNTFFTEHLRTAATGNSRSNSQLTSPIDIKCFSKICPTLSSKYLSKLFLVSPNFSVI